MMKIQEVHQKTHAKQFLLFYFNCFLLVTHLNLSDLRNATDLVTYKHHSHENMKEFVMTYHMSCHIQSYHES